MLIFFKNRIYAFKDMFLFENTPFSRAPSFFNEKQRKEKEFRTKTKIHEIAKAPLPKEFFESV